MIERKATYGFAKKITCLGVPELVLRRAVEDTNRLRIQSISKEEADRPSSETYDAKDRVPFSTVTKSLINYTVFICRLLTCSIL
jgi:hypothetical protein